MKMSLKTSKWAAEEKKGKVECSEEGAIFLQLPETWPEELGDPGHEILEGKRFKVLYDQER